MSEHVDIVKNEWLSGLQIRVAVVTLEGEDVKVITGDPSWDEFVHRPIFDAASGAYVHSSKEPTHFFKLLPTTINSSYVFAIPAHSTEACPFHDANVLALKPHSVETRAS